MDLPPPPADDDHFVNPAYTSNPSDVTDSYVSDSRVVIEESPHVSPPPFHTYDVEAGPDNRSEPIRSDEIGGVLAFDYPPPVVTVADQRIPETNDYRIAENQVPRPGNYAGYLPTDTGDYNQNYPGDGKNRSLANPDDSFDSVVIDEERKDRPDVGMSRLKGLQDKVAYLKGLENEAYSYDADADTDMSYSFQGSPVEPPVMRNPDPFPVLERPLSGRYQKNPTLERKKPSVPYGPYDPQVGVFLSPPISTKKEPSTDSTKVRKRIPRPPSTVRMKCAYFWACCACLIGNFLCAIPALRYVCIASESRKIGDFNSAHSYLRKTAILAAVAIGLAVGAWAVLILYFSGGL